MTTPAFDDARGESRCAAGAECAVQTPGRQPGQSRPRRLSQTAVSVVLPVYNESAVLSTLVERIRDAVTSVVGELEIVFVNDGSSDDSPQLLDELAETVCGVRVLHLSRNFGHQAAVHAGLQAARGDVVVVMDSDLQDDPKSLPQLLAAWEAGHDVVYAVRTQRKEGILKRALFYSFYRVLNRISDLPIPKDAGNFGVLDRRVVDRIGELTERDRYYPGLRRWVGFRQIGIQVERAARHDNQPRVSGWQLFRLAKTAIFSFSSFPLTVFYSIAAVSMLVCLAVTGFTLYHRFVTELAVPGWTSIIIASSFFGALNALGIAILGEYVIRIYDQVRARPQYIVEREHASDNRERNPQAVLEWVEQHLDQPRLESLRHSSGHQPAGEDLEGGSCGKHTECEQLGGIGEHIERVAP